MSRPDEQLRRIVSSANEIIDLVTDPPRPWPASPWDVEAVGWWRLLLGDAREYAERALAEIGALEAELARMAERSPFP